MWTALRARLLRSAYPFPAMVVPTINRKRGKTREQRVRDNRRKNKANLIQSGKMPKPQTRDGNGISKKKAKKLAQRAKLQGKDAKMRDTTMEDAAFHY